MLGFLIFLFFFSGIGLIAFLFFHLEKSQRTSIQEASSYLKDISRKEDLTEFAKDHPIFEIYHDAVPLVPPFIAKVSNIGVLSDRCFPITSSGVFLFSYQDTFEFFQKEVQKKCKRLNIHYFSWFKKKNAILGTVAILGWIHESNYYHWMTEVLSKLAILKESKIHFDKVLISARKGHSLCPYEIESLEAFGIDVKEDLILCSRPCRYSLETGLIIPPAHTVLGTPSLWYVRHLNKVIFKNAPINKWMRKIFISRKGFRRDITNEDQLMSHLRSKGFESICLTGLSIQDQAKIFAEASIIIAPHGAALTNLMFCSSGTRLIEIMPSKNVVMKMTMPFSFKNLANALLLKYDSVHARSLDESFIHSDLEVCIDEILELLSEKLTTPKITY